MSESPVIALSTFASLEARAQVLGLALRGAFHPLQGEYDHVLGAAPVGTIVLLGFTGSEQWAHFAAAREAADGIAHPLDRWSRRVISQLARECGARDVYPSGNPVLPFQQLAMRCEPVHPSPLGLLIHPVYGLWHAYRGALLLPTRLELPLPSTAKSPCEDCKDRPCLSGCPVNAFGARGFVLERCVSHLEHDAGLRCVTQGCLAREACPVGAQYRYVPDQMRFHMDAFHRAVAPRAR